MAAAASGGAGAVAGAGPGATALLRPSYPPVSIPVRYVVPPGPPTAYPNANGQVYVRQPPQVHMILTAVYSGYTGIYRYRIYIETLAVEFCILKF